MDLLTALPQLVAVVEKGGVVGAFLVMIVGLILEVRRGRKHVHDLRGELHKIYAQRDRALLIVVKLKTACEAKGVAVDISDVKDLVAEYSPTVPPGGGDS